MAAETTKIESLAESNTSEDKKYLRWKEEIALADKESETFLKQGYAVYDRFKDERKDADASMRKFNIFSANVGILRSSLFSKIPKMEVNRRFGQVNDDAARVAALMIGNILRQDLEDENCDYVQVIKHAITDRLCPGLGCAWLRLNTETEEKVLPEVKDPITGEVLQAAATFKQVKYQEVPVDYVHWDDILISPCRTWEERRWVARRTFLDRDSLVKRFGSEKGNRVSLNYKPGTVGKQENNNPVNDVLQKAVVYEIWDRTTKKVIWLSTGYTELLDERDDPLKLEEFEPFPKPLFATQSTNNVIPVADFVMMQDQYDEMDTVNNRISILVEACKVAGVYDSSATGVQRLLEEGYENTLIPVDNWAMFAEKGGIKGQIDWFPLDTVVQALQYLRQAREDIKGQIYELSGISDIVRGDTKASETLGAQKIKAQFASVRIQALQEDVALFAQKILQIKAEIICRHFTQAQLIEQSNIPFSLDGRNAMLIQQAIGLIKGPHEKFQWRVKIQADSLAQADYQLEKQEKVEFINATATFMQSAATMIEREPSMAPMMMDMLKFGISGFRGSAEMEGSIDQTLAMFQQKLQNPPPPQPDPAVIKAQADIQAKQQDAQLRQQEKQQDMMIRERESQQELRFTAAMNAMEIRHQEMMNTLERTQKMFEAAMKEKEQKETEDEQTS